MTTDSGCVTSYQIGTATGGLFDVRIEPQGLYYPGIDLGFSGEGYRIEGGYPQAEWVYIHDWVCGLAWKQLMDVVGDEPSAPARITTLTNDVDAWGWPVFKTYDCLMHRPEGEPWNRWNGEQCYRNVKVRFSRLEEVT